MKKGFQTDTHGNDVCKQELAFQKQMRENAALRRRHCH